MIAGSASINESHGASPVADGSPEVEGNQVAGALACSGTTRPATNDGVPNTAAGAKTGECASL